MSLEIRIAEKLKWCGIAKRLFLANCCRKIEMSKIIEIEICFPVNLNNINKCSINELTNK